MRLLQPIMIALLVGALLVPGTSTRAVFAADEDHWELDEGLFDDTPLPEQEKPVQDPTTPVAFEQILRIKPTIFVKYTYYHAKLTTTVTYDFTIEHRFDRPQALASKLNTTINGESTPTIHTDGILAKWSGGECLPTVTVPQINFKGLLFEEERSATLNITQLSAQEEWGSDCKVFGLHEQRLYKTPEQYINVALNALTEHFSKFVFQTSETFETVVPFEIEVENVDDEVGRLDVYIEGSVELLAPQVKI